MRYYAGLDVSLAETSICIVDEDGKIIREAKVASEPEPLATWLGDLGFPLSRVGLETGALAGWLAEEMTELGVPNMVCMDARPATCSTRACQQWGKLTVDAGAGNGPVRAMREAT